MCAFLKFRENKEERKAFGAKMQYSKIMLTNQIAKSGNILKSLTVRFLFCECCDWKWVITKEYFSSHILVFFGEREWFKNIFLRFARSIKILHHGKMLGIFHSPVFLFKPLHTAEIFLKQLYSQSGSSLEGKNGLGMYEQREFGPVLSDQNSKFSCNRWIDPAATRTFRKFKKDW